MDCVAILPSYKPDVRLLTLIDELEENDIGVLVVDDGSGEEYGEIFKKASLFDLSPILENGIYIWANFGAVRINDCYKAEVLLTV